MRSPARMRWPVLEIGRNSVRPSTMPRMNASIRLVILLSEKAADRRPEFGGAVGAIVPGASQLHPSFRPTPGVKKAPRMDYGNDFVALGDQTEQRHGNARRKRG